MTIMSLSKWMEFHAMSRAPPKTKSFARLASRIQILPSPLPHLTSMLVSKESGRESIQATLHTQLPELLSLQSHIFTLSLRSRTGGDTNRPARCLMVSSRLQLMVCTSSINPVMTGVVSGWPQMKLLEMIPTLLSS